MTDLETPADVSQLVDAFYGRVRRDDQLGPIFNDVARVDWAKHLPRIASFWNTVLLGSGEYAGNPVLVHLALAQKTKLTPAHFDRWLTLFTETIDELFTGLRAENAKIRAHSIATVLQTKLYGAGLLSV